MSTDKIVSAAKLLADAWKSKEQIADFPADFKPADRAEAYAIQDEMAKLLGYEVAGWKLGVSSPGGLKALNMDGPVPGRMFKRDVKDSPAEWSKADFVGPVMEPEFAFNTKADIVPREAAYTEVELAPLADLYCAIEIAGNRAAMPAPPAFDGMMMIADDGGNAAFVVGPKIENWQDVDIPAVPCTLEFDGALGAESLSGEARCQPIWVLTWLANDLSARGITLPAGSWVSTGSGTKPTPLGDAIETVGVFGELGKVVVKLV